MSADAEAGDAGTRLRLDIAYDGTGFAGWAKQPGLRTVQGALEGALAQLLARTPPAPTLVVAGRTDAGVHATGQVAHVDLTDAQIASLDRPPRGRGADAAGEGPHAPSVERAAAALARRMNGVLGPRSDAVVLACAPAPDGFDARFSATWRAYRYRISDTSGPRDPLQRHRTVEVPVALDAAVLQQAADALLGLHDFAAYCKPREGASTIRTLQDLTWARAADGALEAAVRADAFCHSMVRALVGACVAAASGRVGVARLRELLELRERTSEFTVMPARGLVLERVGYPPDAELAARNEVTRNRRAAHEVDPVTEGADDAARDLARLADTPGIA
ncbi:tRNA pseudouridine synthase A [Clavibacter michiganensis]|uniref:tRNA pseudouridine synthase A n=1 Tax=Clavibacter michiganensis subsp. insidiosus TaxID=33014 RepID=A0A0D5CJZ8_9MICO|nr:tRNA pseudouridine synthase A [Clavibacter michiganensis]AJW79963.1 pseudouridine synthase [Clavibacter michiganensis subsp. insidiosus]AWF97401.1 tRNA pseudouridine synthase A [Clavibacter michiganensis subsp. insidiosus]AWG02508.1 tRNA pseudouridine synthase A [Clavibacter michiganensis subsp. insidiosus]